MQACRQKLNEEKLALYLAGIEHWNAGEFFECHEKLEKIWLCAGNDRAFFQGLIQAAAAFLKIKQKSQGRGISLLKTALVKLSTYPTLHLGLNVRSFSEQLYNHLKILEDSLEKQEPVPELQFPKLELKLG